MQARHLGAGTGFIDEHQLCRTQFKLLLKLGVVCGCYVGALPFGDVRRLCRLSARSARQQYGGHTNGNLVPG